jgi:hypothetical protein
MTDDGSNDSERPTSDHPATSRNGRIVVWESEAPDLVPDDNNGLSDVFVRDRCTGVTSRVSVDSRGREGNDGSHPSSYGQT